MADTKAFHIGDILSVTTGRLVSPDHIGGVYNILGWLVGEDLMTHQLPRVARECEGFLREQFPDLPTEDDMPEFDGEESVLAWLAEAVAQHGETREVPKMPEVDHTQINPLMEFQLMRPDAEIIPVIL